MAAPIKLFGFEIKRTDKETDPPESVVSPAMDDGAININSGAHYGIYVDLDGSYRSEVDLLSKYRTMAMQPEMENAIDDIINEAIVHDEHGKSVEIVLDDLKVGDDIKKLIRDEFETVLRLLDFNKFGPEIFRRWYVDGRAYWNVIIDSDNPRDGIQQLVFIDPRRIKKIRNITKEKNADGIEVIKKIEVFYLYNEKIVNNNIQSPQIIGNFAGGVKLSQDSVIHLTSGLFDPAKSVVLSYLHKAIRPMNQLRFIEDATVIYKVSRAPERRVFYVDTGNLPRAKAEQYLKDIMTKFRNKVIYDSGTGEIRDDRKHTAMLEDFWMPRRCLALNTKVQLLDGRNETLQTLIDEHEQGKTNWTMSVTPQGKLVPGKIKWAGVTRKDAQVLRVTLDNGESITCTPDHRFILRDGSEVEAQTLQSGTSLMPAYTRIHRLSGQYSKQYHQSYDLTVGGWLFTHRIVSEDKARPAKSNEHIHHVDLNRFNNSPENLRLMDKQDHIRLHQEISRAADHSNPEWKQKLSVSGEAFFNTEEGMKRREEIRQQNKTDERIQAGWAKGRQVVSEKYKDAKAYHNPMTGDEIRVAPAMSIPEGYVAGNGNDGAEWYYNPTTGQRLFLVDGEAPEDFVKGMGPGKQRWFKSQDNTKSVFVIPGSEPAGFVPGRVFKWNTHQPSFNNHKVASVEWLDVTIDTGDLTIEGDNHNFALTAGVFVHNSGDKSTEITTLPAGQGFDNMDAVLYFEKKLYRALCVPISRLESGTGFNIGRPEEISRDELKFDKFVQKLRNRFSILFDELLARQLTLKGVCTLDEWAQFKQVVHYKFVKDNNFTELKEAELLTNRINTLVLMEPFVGQYFSKKWVQINVLQLDEHEIDEMEKQMNKEAAKLEKEAGDLAGGAPPGPPPPPGPGKTGDNGAPTGAAEPQPTSNPAELNKRVANQLV